MNSVEEKFNAYVKCMVVSNEWCWQNADLVFNDSDFRFNVHVFRSVKYNYLIHLYFFINNERAICFERLIGQDEFEEFVKFDGMHIKRGTEFEQYLVDIILENNNEIVMEMI